MTKKYKNFVSVNNVSLHIRKGSIYGFLGPNGAGKSTTMKMLLGLTAPTKGSFAIDGRHFPEDRITILKGVGSFIESPSFYANLTGRENLDIIRRILGLPGDSVDDALELVGLEEFGGRLAKKYSLAFFFPKFDSQCIHNLALCFLAALSCSTMPRNTSSRLASLPASMRLGIW